LGHLEGSKRGGAVPRHLLCAIASWRAATTVCPSTDSCSAWLVHPAWGSPIGRKVPVGVTSRRDDPRCKSNAVAQCCAGAPKIADRNARCSSVRCVSARRPNANAHGRSIEVQKHASHGHDRDVLILSKHIGRVVRVLHQCEAAVVRVSYQMPNAPIGRCLHRLQKNSGSSFPMRTRASRRRAAGPRRCSDRCASDRSNSRWSRGEMVRYDFQSVFRPPQRGPIAPPSAQTPTNRSGRSVQPRAIASITVSSRLSR